jgi:hypothetical protein
VRLRVRRRGGELGRDDEWPLVDRDRRGDGLDGRGQDLEPRGRDGWGRGHDDHGHERGSAHDRRRRDIGGSGFILGVRSGGGELSARIHRTKLLCQICKLADDGVKVRSIAIGRRRETDVLTGNRRFLG